MRLIAILAAIALPGAALAHPGHLAEAAGHGHWLAAAALGLAAAVAIWAGLRDRKAAAAQEEAEEAPDAEAGKA